MLEWQADKSWTGRVGLVKTSELLAGNLERLDWTLKFHVK